MTTEQLWRDPSERHRALDRMSPSVLLALEHDRGLHGDRDSDSCPYCHPAASPRLPDAASGDQVECRRPCCASASSAGSASSAMTISSSGAAAGFSQPHTTAATEEHRLLPGVLAAALERIRAGLVIDQIDEPASDDACKACRGAGYVRRDVPVDHPDFGRALPCGACGIIARQRHERLLGTLPEHFRDVSIETYPAQASGQRRLIECLRGWLQTDRWLYLYGSPGRGKTSLAAAALKHFDSLGQSCAFAVASDLLGRLRHSYGDDGQGPSETDLLESLARVDVLVLDDVGTGKCSEWVAEKLFQIIGHRYDEHRRTVVTSNLSLEELSEYLGHPRVASRIGELARPFMLDLSDLPNLRVSSSSDKVVPLVRTREEASAV